MTTPTEARIISPTGRLQASLPGSTLRWSLQSILHQNNEICNLGHNPPPLKALKEFPLPPGMKSRFRTMREDPAGPCSASLSSLSSPFYPHGPSNQPGFCFRNRPLSLLWSEHSSCRPSRAHSPLSSFGPQMSPSLKSLPRPPDLKQPPPPPQCLFISTTVLFSYDTYL